MTEQHDDLADFLERRFSDRHDRDDIPEQEILDALREWPDHGCPHSTMSITYHAERLDHGGSA